MISFTLICIKNLIFTLWPDELITLDHSYTELSSQSDIIANGIVKLLDIFRKDIKEQLKKQLNQQ